MQIFLNLIPIFLICFEISHCASIVTSEFSNEAQITECTRDDRSTDDVIFVCGIYKYEHKVTSVSQKLTGSRSNIKDLTSESKARKRKQSSEEDTQRKDKLSLDDVYARLDEHSRGNLAVYKLHINKIFENMKEDMNFSYFTFSFKCLFVEETTHFLFEKTIYFLISKEVILLKNICRFDVFINIELKEIFSSSTEHGELKALKKNIIAFETQTFVKITNHYQLFYVPNQDFLYSDDFIGHWKNYILTLLEQKNHYIYLILPEFISFEIKLKEKLDYVTLKHGTYFLAIFKLKLLINNPIISKIQQKYKENPNYKSVSNSAKNEDRKWFLYKKGILRKKFMKILKIFSISIEHNILYSMLLTFEKMIYFNVVKDKFASIYLYRYHMLNILNDLLFLIDKTYISNIIIKIDTLIDTFTNPDMNEYPLITFREIIVDLDLLIKKQFIILYIRILNFFRSKNIFREESQSGEKEFINYIIQTLEIFSKSDGDILRLHSKHAKKEYFYDINTLLLLGSCLIKRIFRNRFGIVCCFNLNDHFQDFFDR
ncbi:hypothetical protein CWI36_0474p0010 [Hamiltosporidium magnivora]|uniref:Uncharacterized protein n=2 Tax=Hamiltosporidium magnivora TaxID=148818 RepID=A0A4Q9LGL0_9MICR|nr:hypothetical protein CWI36_0474p0010 [Hamiltosporidium magnivora]